jgi:FkbM family methyltransferase
MEEYLKNIPVNTKNIKLDIGLSYNAPQSNKWLSNEANLFVFGFEPNPECVNTILQKNIVKRHPNHGEPLKNEFIESRFRLIPFALSNVTEPTRTNFYAMTNDVGTSSLYRPNDQQLGPVKFETSVDVYSLKHFFDLFSWDRFDYIDYIKIDAQGADFDIIKSAGDYLKERIVFITAEPESIQYSGCHHNTAENMTEYLKTQGFERINHPNTSDPTFLNAKYKHLYNKIYISQY